MKFFEATFEVITVILAIIVLVTVVFGKGEGVIY